MEQRKLPRDKEGWHIMLKGSIFSEDVAIVNEYIPNNRSVRYVKRKLTERRN